MDINNVFKVNNLIDVYGDFLTKKQLEIMVFYYRDNCSLSEIAESLGITRQAVNYSIKQSIDTLNRFENKLHLVEIKDILLNESDCSLKEKILSRMEE